jgi:beta-glucanase (GH16 family)
MRESVAVRRSCLIPSLVAAVALASCSSESAPATGGGTADDAATEASDSSTDATMDAPDAPAADDAGDDADAAGWTLTWSDEFNQPDGSAADPSKWIHDVGGGGWGNQEREYYTDGTKNAQIVGGALVITATPTGAAQYTCWYGPCGYTSARLLTKGKFSQQYGRFEARIWIPFGQGLWPAFWLLGDDIDQVGWPACGEIDTMENIGKEPSTVHGSLHAPGFDTGAANTLPGNQRFADAWHVFGIEWDATSIRFYVDGTLYETRTPSDVPKTGKWAFDHAFFLLLNVAVGGNWPGDPNGTTTWPQTMKVDWVRAYKK